jgi:uncharacterized cupin superfamily protein
MCSAHPTTVARASDVPVRSRATNYPEPFALRVAGRIKRPLGDHFGLRNFGINLTTLAPGAISALRHAHTLQDEFIYVLSGRVRLECDSGVWELDTGMCAGFPAGTGNAHRLVNPGSQEATYLEVGDRTPGDAAIYPDDDLVAQAVNGTWVFFHKDGQPY